MENNKEEAKKTAQKVGGLMFVGCMFIGMAAGKFYPGIGMTVGLFAGMGIGFIMMAVVWMSAVNKK